MARRKKIINVEVDVHQNGNIWVNVYRNGNRNSWAVDRHIYIKYSSRKTHCPERLLKRARFLQDKLIGE